MTTPIPDLTALRAIAEAATEGPWEAYDANEGMDRAYSPLWCVANDEFHNPTTGDDDDWIAVEIHVGDKADSDHIAAFDPPTAIALLDRLEAAEATIQRVRDLHREVPYWTKPNRPAHVPEYACYHCIDLGDGVVAYPCPTIRALDGEA